MRRAVVALACAGMVGVVTGVLARLLMRVIALLGQNALEFRVGASIGIVLVFVVALIPGALAAAFTMGWWRWLIGLPTTAFLLVTGFAIAAGDVADIRNNDLSALRWGAIYALSAVVLILVVAQLVLVVRLVDHKVRGGALWPARVAGGPGIPAETFTI